MTGILLMVIIEMIAIIATIAMMAMIAITALRPLLAKCVLYYVFTNSLEKQTNE